MDTKVFEALADDKRLAIVELLAAGELCVCDVSGSLGISNALASHHLKKLREAGIVRTRRKGAWLHCRLEDGALTALADDLNALAARIASTPTGCCGRTTNEESDSDE